MNVLDEEDTSNLEQETYEGGDGEDSSDSENLPEASVGDVAATASNEPTEDQKREIARWIKEGMGLSSHCCECAPSVAHEASLGPNLRPGRLP